LVDQFLCFVDVFVTAAPISDVDLKSLIHKSLTIGVAVQRNQHQLGLGGPTPDMRKSIAAHTRSVVATVLI
jgi:hypothetical protein